MIVTPEMLAFARSIRVRNDAIRQWLGRRTSYRLEELPPRLSPTPTNEEQSRAEVIEFLNRQRQPGVSYIAYLSSDRKNLTTWTGDILATINWIRWRRVRDSAFTDERGRFHARGIDGRDYYGSHNGPAVYCRLRLRISN
jgi:hypothetical protein